MKLPRPAWTVVTAAVVGGSSLLVWAGWWMAVHSGPTGLQLAVLGSVLVTLLAGWTWPLMIFVGKDSKGIQFDEFAFVVLVLFVPDAYVLLPFAVATVVGQAVRRQSMVKAAFNAGQVLVAAAAGCAVFGALSPSGGLLAHAHALGVGAHLSLLPALPAAVLGALTYLAANSAAVTAILAATGTPWRHAFDADLGLRLVFEFGSMAVALTTAVMIAESPWLIMLAFVPPLLLRWVLADQFEARRDHARVRGLFEATVSANRGLGDTDVEATLVQSARDLLRCSEAWVTDRPDEGSLRALLSGHEGARWLAVDGRSRTEPFDVADQSLLEALAAVGAGAMDNASLYEEGRFQRERLSAITSSMGEGVCAITRHGYVTFVNPTACKLLGWKPEAGIGGSGQTISGLRAPPSMLAPARHAIASGTVVTSFDTRFERSDGTYFHVAFTASPIIIDDVATGAVLVFRDITERKEFEEQLARHAFHDSLTGLPNRRLFLDHLEHAMRRSTRSSERHAVLFVDVDRFKMINDSLGHSAGDHLLVAIAQRMCHSLRPGDMLARFGGDEFTILLEQVDDADEAVAVARRILSQMRLPVTLPDGHEVVVTMSIGIALTTPGKSADDLLHDADVAMYQIKSKGRGGQFEVFDADAMGVRSAERIELEAGLRRAIDENELEVYYQPLFAMSDCHIVGAEALVRWRHPERGLLGPGSFIGMAEDCGLILPLGRQVLNTACQQVRRWNDRFGADLVVGVNLSARQFQQADLVADVAEVIQSSGVNPGHLSLEITESLAMDDVERTRDILLGLKALGVRVAIDDFGTGYSALGYLARFPVDVVKIDRSFVEDVEVDPVKSAIVSAVITLSDAIGTTTVVEGVETREQFDHLRGLGCIEVQGFHLARPMPADQLGELLRVTTKKSEPVARRSPFMSAVSRAV